MAIADFGFGVQATLRQRMLDEMAQQKLAHDQWAQEQQLSQGDRRISQDASQFDARLGQDKDELGFRRQVHTDEAPERDARTGYLRTQSTHLEGTDARTAAEREFETARDAQQHKYRLGEIGASQAGRTQPKTSAEELAEFEAKEQIKAKYGGSKPSLGAEKNALNYFNRMLEAERNARAVEDKLSPRDIAASEYAPDMIENWLKTKEGQAYTQAQRMFTEARLRKESGAAIPPAEFESDRRTNFRIAGDKDMSQKRRSRLTTMRGIGTTAGRAIQEYYGDDATLDSILKEFEAQEAAGRPEAKVIRQRNAKTGQVRISQDGGQTWQIQ